MTRCAVYGCNSTNKCKKLGMLHFHRFPKTKSISRQWIHACCRADKLNFETARVCSRHFKATDYTQQYNMKRKLFSKPPQATRSLKVDAVPSLFLPNQENDSDSVPSVFSKTSEGKRKRALGRYNRWNEIKRCRSVIKKTQELAKSQLQPSVEEVRTGDESASVSEENIPSDSDTMSVISGMLDSEEVSWTSQKEEQRELRDGKNAEELYNSTSIPVSHPPRTNTSDAAPDLIFSTQDKLNNGACFFNDTCDDSSDDDDDDDGAKYEDPTTLLYTGKTKELMRLLQLYRKSLEESEETQELSDSREQKANSDATPHLDHQHVTSFKKRLKEKPLNEQQAITVDTVTYVSVLTIAQEQAVINYLTTASKIYAGLTQEEICYLICSFCLNTNITVPPAWLTNYLAAMDWTKGFIRRHQIFHLLHTRKKIWRDNLVENVDNGVSSAARRNISGKEVPPGFCMCEDGVVRSSGNIISTIGLDHSYAARPGTTVKPPYNEPVGAKGLSLYSKICYIQGSVTQPSIVTQVQNVKGSVWSHKYKQRAEHSRGHASYSSLSQS